MSLSFQRDAELRKKLKKVDTKWPENQVPSRSWFSGKVSFSSSSGHGGPLSADNSWHLTISPLRVGLSIQRTHIEVYMIGFDSNLWPFAFHHPSMVFTREGKQTLSFYHFSRFLVRKGPGALVRTAVLGFVGFALQKVFQKAWSA